MDERKNNNELSLDMAQGQKNGAPREIRTH